MKKAAPYIKDKEKLTLNDKVDFLFMRHAESQDNFQHIVPSTKNCKGLTAFGIEQAKQAAQFLKSTDFKSHTILASPILRARQTAQIISEVLGLDVIFSELLQEQNLGDWEGKSWSEVMPLLETRVLPPAGETYDEFGYRMDQVAAYLTIAKDRSPLVIAHGGIWYGLSTKFSSGPLLMPSNAEIRSVTLKDGVLTHENKFSVNEKAHKTK